MILTFQTSAEAQATYQSLLVFFCVVAVAVAITITFHRNQFRSDWLWGILLGAFISILGYLVARDTAFGPFASLEATESQITFRYIDASTPAITLKKNEVDQILFGFNGKTFYPCYISVISSSGTRYYSADTRSIDCKLKRDDLIKLFSGSR